MMTFPTNTPCPKHCCRTQINSPTVKVHFLVGIADEEEGVWIAATRHGPRTLLAADRVVTEFDSALGTYSQLNMVESLAHMLQLLSNIIVIPTFAPSIARGLYGAHGAYVPILVEMDRRRGSDSKVELLTEVRLAEAVGLRRSVAIPSHAQ